MNTLSAIFFYIAIPIAFGALWAYILKPDHWFRSIVIGLGVILAGIIDLYSQLKNNSFLSFSNVMSSSGFVASFGWALFTKGIITLYIRKRITSNPSSNSVD